MMYDSDIAACYATDLTVRRLNGDVTTTGKKVLAPIRLCIRWITKRYFHYHKYYALQNCEGFMRNVSPQLSGLSNLYHNCSAIAI